MSFNVSLLQEIPLVVAVVQMAVQYVILYDLSTGLWCTILETKFRIEARTLTYLYAYPSVRGEFLHNFVNSAGLYCVCEISLVSRVVMMY